MFANNARLRAGLKKIEASYKNNTALSSPARPKTATEGPRRAVLTPEFRSLARAFSSLLESSRASRSPGRAAFSADQPATPRRPGRELILSGPASSPATPIRRGNIVQAVPAPAPAMQAAGRALARSMATTEVALRELHRQGASMATLANTNAALVAHLLGTPSPASRVPTPTPRRAVAPIPLRLRRSISPSVRAGRRLRDREELLARSPASPESRPLGFDEAEDAEENGQFEEEDAQ